MRGVLVLALTAVAVADRLREESGWDIYPEMSVMERATIDVAHKTRGHELITIAAMDEVLGGAGEGRKEFYMELSGTGLKEVLSKTAMFNGVRPWVGGVLWNDMPTPDGNLGAENSITMAANFKAFNEPLVMAVHKGCLQQAHAMAPSCVPGDKQCTKQTFTNAQIRKLIRVTLQRWWSKVVSFSMCAMNGVDTDDGTDGISVGYAKFFMGHILHLFQDSYAMGHTVRDWSNDGCGKIHSFQGYDLQDGEKHGYPDHVQTNPEEEKNPGTKHDPNELPSRNRKMFDCSVKSTANLLRAFYELFPRGAKETKTGSNKIEKATAMVLAEFERVIVLDPSAEGLVGGGSAKKYVSDGACGYHYSLTLAASERQAITPAECNAQGGAWTSEEETCKITICLPDRNLEPYKGHMTPRAVCCRPADGQVCPAAKPVVAGVVLEMVDVGRCPSRIEASMDTNSFTNKGNANSFIAGLTTFFGKMGDTFTFSKSVSRFFGTAKHPLTEAQIAHVKEYSTFGEVAGADRQNRFKQERLTALRSGVLQAS